MELDILCNIEPHEWKKFTKKLNDIGKYVEHRGYNFKYSLKNYDKASFIIYLYVHDDTGGIVGEAQIPYIFVEELKKCFPDVEINLAKN